MSLKVKEIPTEQWKRLIPFYQKHKSESWFKNCAGRATKCIVLLSEKQVVVGSIFMREGISELDPSITKMKVPFPMSAEVKIIDILLSDSIDEKETLGFISNEIKTRYKNALLYVPREQASPLAQYAKFNTGNFANKQVLSHNKGTIYLQSAS